MSEMDVAVTAQVDVRDEFGRYISLVEAAGEATLADIADTGMQRAKEFAPRGRRRDPRTVSIRDGMFKWVGLNTVRWGSSARHALPQETGSVAHDQPADVSFWWENRGRRWISSIDPRIDDPEQVIHHPGNPATRYLRRSYDWVMTNWYSIARKHYPR